MFVISLFFLWLPYSGDLFIKKTAPGAADAFSISAAPGDLAGFPHLFMHSLFQSALTTVKSLQDKVDQSFGDALRGATDVVAITPEPQLTPSPDDEGGAKTPSELLEEEQAALSSASSTARTQQQNAPSETEFAAAAALQRQNQALLAELHAARKERDELQAEGLSLAKRLGYFELRTRELKTELQDP